MTLSSVLIDETMALYLGLFFNVSIKVEINGINLPLLFKAINKFKISVSDSDKFFSDKSKISTLLFIKVNATI